MRTVYRFIDQHGNDVTPGDAFPTEYMDGSVGTIQDVYVDHEAVYLTIRVYV